MRPILRSAAHLATGVGLAMLGWSALMPVVIAPSSVSSAVLWTAGADQPARPNRANQYALPDAVNAPSDAVRIPDAAFLRRTLPDLAEVELRGHGLDAADAAALRGLRVSWQRPEKPTIEAPRLIVLSSPRNVIVGQRPVIQGRIAGLPTDEPLSIGLEAPNGTKDTIAIKGDGNDGVAFSITGAAPVAPGNYQWRLRVGTATEPIAIGIIARAADVPRVLLLQASPSVELARLQRWLADAGSRVTTRTRVSADHVRTASANASPRDVPRLGQSVLREFDVVMATESALLELTTDEQQALRDAIETAGLGLLVVGDAAHGALDEVFAPWRASPRPVDITDPEPRQIRLRLADGTMIEEPVTALDEELATLPLVRALARDSRDRLVAAALPRDHGLVARSLIIDTWRWLQAGQDDAYGAYWSGILSALARPVVAVNGQWRLVEPSAPVFVDERVQLAWSGDSAARPTGVAVLDEGNARIQLPVTADPRDNTVARAVYWPGRPGWHALVATTTGSPNWAFHVQSREALPGVHAERRRIATETLVAAAHDGIGDSAITTRNRTLVTPLAASGFVLFVLAAGVLWIDHRLSGGVNAASKRGREPSAPSNAENQNHSLDRPA